MLDKKLKALRALKEDMEKVNCNKPSRLEAR